MLAGKTGAQSQMFVARININGEVDIRFGQDGILRGTPRGFDRIDQIVPLPVAGGGYIAVEASTENGSAVTRLLALTARGRVNSAFGHNGATGLVINLSQVLTQPDGKILVVGTAAT